MWTISLMWHIEKQNDEKVVNRDWSKLTSVHTYTIGFV